MSPSSSARARRRSTCWRKSSPRSSRLFPGPRPCAGAQPPPSRARCAGCARCTRLSRVSGRRPKTLTSCLSKSAASRPATPPSATVSWRRSPSRCGGSTTTCRRWKRPRSCSIRRGAATSSCMTAEDLAFAQGLEMVEDEGLLHEVAGLVEWPVVLMGEFDASFLDIPGEVIRATIRANQKCFVLRDRATGKLANKFLLVSNILASDGGKAIAAGDERVVRAASRMRATSGRPTLRRCRLCRQGEKAARSAARETQFARHRVP